MERTPKEWQSLVSHFKQRIASLKALMESEYGQMENKKKKAGEVGEANSKGSSKS